MRGEQLRHILLDICLLGSPPLARGTVYRVARLGRFGGITPACAGNSSQIPHCRYQHQDHPRLRGEQINTAHLLQNTRGSPPLARGAASDNLYMLLHRRITPACAGNSLVGQVIYQLHWDHPRLRGEQMLHAVTCAQQRGSPPLARGTDVRPLARVRNRGITPACAGNSLVRPTSAA